MIKTGLIGRGYWGKKIESKLDELSKKIFVQTSKNYNPAKFTSVNWIFIATPVDSHYQIAKDCILRGVNVFIEKPFCSSFSEAKELIELAQTNNVYIYVDNVFLYRSELVNISFPQNNLIRFVWYKNGPFQDSLVNDLLYHDLYILVNILGFENISRLKCQLNERDFLKFEFFYGNCKVEMDYKRTISGPKQKQIYIDEKIIDFTNVEEDPLKKIISDCLTGKADFKFNHSLNLKATDLMEIVRSKLKKLEHEFQK